MDGAGSECSAWLGLEPNSKKPLRFKSDSYSQACLAETNLRGEWKSGSPSWTRTNDLGINSPALYQLSYRGSGAARRNSSVVQLVKAPGHRAAARHGGPERNRTAVEGFADPCLTTRPPDHAVPLSGRRGFGSSARLAAWGWASYKWRGKGEGTG